MTFYVGQKIVCVNTVKGIFDNPNITYADLGLPLSKGQIYTIRALTYNKKDNTYRLLLKEVPDRREGDTGFARERFRPLVDDHKGMTTLRSILNNPQQFIRKDKFDKEKL